ncbi:hypothetical protein N8Z24_00680 [bacterium]|nr:hypothetical protein [bacterium]
MAMTGINPVQPEQKINKTSGGRLARPLGTLGGLIGGIGGGITGAAPGLAAENPVLAWKGGAAGATKGFLMGTGAGAGLGNLIDPQRTSTQTIGPRSTGSVGGMGGGVESLAQKYKMSDSGRAALQGLAVARQNPQWQSYQEPLGMAVMQDIGANNRQGMA